MDNVTLARATMGTSLGFHIVFAVLGVGLPLLLVVAEGLWLRTRDPVWLTLARRWAKAFGILFAVGAVSGTALSFELGLLWPRFMAFSGAIFGLLGILVVLFLRRGLPLQQLGVVVVLNFFITFTVPNISWQGHVGGFVAGLIIGALIAYTPLFRRRILQR